MKVPEIASTVLRTHIGVFDFKCYKWGTHEDECVLSLSRKPFPAAPWVRVQSACFTAEIFRSLDCDCHEQLEESLKRIQTEGGVLVYLIRDGRGAGIFVKTLGMELTRTKGTNTADAYRTLGVTPDPRTYERAAFVLRDFQLHKIRLLTNNPRKVSALGDHGFDVDRVPLEIPATRHSAPYLRSKVQKLGHMMKQFDKGAHDP